MSSRTAGNFREVKISTTDSNRIGNLPRNRIMATKNLKRPQREAKKEIIKKTNAFNILYEKYNIGPLTFRSTQFITPDGIVTKVNHTEIKGNLRNGILLINFSDMATLEEKYDLYNIAVEKRKKDFAKKEEEFKKRQLEFERLKNTAMEADQIEIINDQLDKGHMEEIPKDVQEGIPKDIQKEIPKIIVPERKPNKSTGNKYFRGFMQEIKNHCHLNFQTQYKFAEFRIDSTDMVIDDVDIYKLKDDLFLVIGDFQMKSSVIRQLDPTYDADTVAETNQDFLDKVKIEENIPDLVPVDNN